MASRAKVHEMLIDAVREHEVLYNSDMKEYNDNILKMKLWRIIARKCDISSGEEAKKIWKNLRDGFRCSIKTLKLYENKEPPRTLKPWKYAEQMEFLRPFMKDRVFSNTAYYDEDGEFTAGGGGGGAGTHADDTSTMGSGDNTHGSVEETIECRPDIGLLPTSTFDEVHGTYEGMDKDHDPDDELSYQQQQQLGAISPSHAHAMGFAPPPKRRGRKRRSEIEHMMDMQMREESGGGNCYDQHPQPPQQQPEDGGLKLFFESMYASVKSLPPHLQRAVRIKLFQAVTDAEVAAESLDAYSHNALNHLSLVYGSGNGASNGRRT